MVRKGFKEWITRRINPVYYSALFSIASGLALFMLLLLWQKSDYIILIPLDWLIWVSQAAFLFSIVGFIWGIRSLGSFDPYGLGSIRRALKGKTTRPSPFIIKGPYKYVRHPLYSFFILMIWSHPYLTLDRLLFNFCWTLWIIVGSYWEEKDLVSVFGEAYLDYRKRVPMLIPGRLGKGLLS
jgi:protein-S-isoprenylcysteine O-methyltransferase Ste14